MVLDTVKNLHKTSTFCDFEKIMKFPLTQDVDFAQHSSDPLYSLKNIFQPYCLGRMELKRLQTSLFCCVEDPGKIILSCLKAKFLSEYIFLIITS